jgi:hypothetical protein
LYLFELSLLFGAGMLLISAIFPLGLPPEYSPQAASAYVPQPDWYFLWIYQVLKVSVFEGQRGLAAALSVITLVFLILVLLPFIDRGKTRSVSRRPIYTSLGLIFVGEVAILSYWGFVTPGETIPIERAGLVIGGTALLITVGSFIAFRLIYSRVKAGLPTASAQSVASSELRSGLAFTGLVALGALSIGSLINGVVAYGLGDISLQSSELVLSSIAGLAIAVSGSIYLIYRLDLRTGSIRRRVKALELGWRD